MEIELTTTKPRVIAVVITKLTDVTRNPLTFNLNPLPGPYPSLTGTLLSLLMQDSLYIIDSSCGYTGNYRLAQSFEPPLWTSIT
jgi:hypothetical protein